MSSTRATIVDIARELGMSKSTVANVLSGTGRFSAETGARVHAVAERLGYATNRAARTLRSGRVGAYGIHLPAISRRLPFYMEFAFGAAEGANSAHADLTLFAGDLEPGRQFAVDGAIVIDPEPDEPVVVALLAAGIPVVSVGTYHGAGESSVVATLDARHQDLQREVLDILRARGRTRPLLVSLAGELGSSWSVDTAQAFESWCTESGCDGAVLEVGADPSGWSANGTLAAAVAAHRADAVVCAGQGSAQIACVILEAGGAQIGRDIDVASLAASPEELRDSRLAVVDLRPFDYGMKAAALLTDLLKDPGNGAHHWFEGARVRYAQS